MAKKLSYEDIPYYAKQFDELIEDLRLKINTVGQTTQNESVFFDSLLYSPVGASYQVKPNYELPCESTRLPNIKSKETVGSLNDRSMKTTPLGIHEIAGNRNDEANSSKMTGCRPKEGRLNEVSKSSYECLADISSRKLETPIRVSHRNT